MQSTELFMNTSSQVNPYSSIAPFYPQNNGGPFSFQEQFQSQHAKTAKPQATKNRISIENSPPKTNPQQTMSYINTPQIQYTKQASNSVAQGYQLNEETSNSSCQNQESLTQIIYTEFQHLPQLPNEMDPKFVLKEIKNLFTQKNWRSVFDGIDNLRILNKWYPQDVNGIVCEFWTEIVSALESSRTPIVKNILIFLKEIFSTSKDIRLDDAFILNIMPIIFLKATKTQKGILKNEVEMILELFVTYCCFDSSIQILANITIEQKLPSVEMAYFTLVRMADNIGENLPKLSQYSLQRLMMSFAFVLDSGKKGIMKTWTIKSLKKLYQLFGPENYYDMIQYSLGDFPKAASLLITAVQEKVESWRRSSIALFINQQKQIQQDGILSDVMNKPFGTKQTQMGKLFSYQQQSQQ